MSRNSLSHAWSLWAMQSTLIAAQKPKSAEVPSSGGATNRFPGSRAPLRNGKGRGSRISRHNSRNSHMPLIDVSHTVESGMLTYKGLPAPVICDYLSREASRKLYAAGTEFQIGRIDMVANTGTYVDSPFHRYRDGKDLSELPLDSLANLKCVVARVEPAATRAIDSLPFKPGDIRGKAVLVQTSWVRH